MVVESSTNADKPLFPNIFENATTYNPCILGIKQIVLKDLFLSLLSSQRLYQRSTKSSVDGRLSADLLRMHAEHRYRNKINDKFSTLQASVPSLGVTKRRLDTMYPKENYNLLEEEAVLDNNSTDYSEGDLEGLAPAKKLNKSVILDKAIEYIKFLELKTNQLQILNERLEENF